MDPNINIVDKFYEAIEEYNNSIKRKPELFSRTTDEYKRGMVFTCLRRYIPVFSSNRSRTVSVRVNELKCTFNSDGTVSTVEIDKHIRYNESWFSTGMDKGEMINTVKQITGREKTIYSTRALNDLSQILKQI